MEGRREVVLVRHGQTEWSLSGKHTGLTDIPLTEAGRGNAEALRHALAGREFARVFTSPLRRAADTCRLAGMGERAELREELVEWDYGDYEGLTTPEIREGRPGWYIWDDGCPGGESAADVGARADAMIADLHELQGDALLFAHGHLLRTLTARWVEHPAQLGGRLPLVTGAVCTLGWEREKTAIRLWNDTRHLPDQ